MMIIGPIFRLVYQNETNVGLPFSGRLLLMDRSCGADPLSFHVTFNTVCSPGKVFYDIKRCR